MRASEFTNLDESIFKLNNVVDFIYDNYFKELIDHVNSGLEVWPLNKSELYSSDLPKNKYINLANELNPLIIYINSGRGNVYYPNDGTMSFSVNENAYNFVRTYGTLPAAVNVFKRAGQPEKANALDNEFSPARIKGSIHHELNHWLDDTLRNQHIGKLITKADDTDPHKRKKIIQQNKPDVALTNYEREAQIHSIVQLKRQYGRQWNRLSFEEMIRLNPSLEKIYDTAKREGWLDEWKQLLLRRMHREGLLGKAMIKS